MCFPGWLDGIGQGGGQPSQDFLNWRTAKRDWRAARPRRPEGGFENREARQAFRQERHDWRDARPERPESMTGGLDGMRLGGGMELGGLMRTLGKGITR